MSISPYTVPPFSESLSSSSSSANESHPNSSASITQVASSALATSSSSPTPPSDISQSIARVNVLSSLTSSSQSHSSSSTAAAMLVTSSSSSTPLSSSGPYGFIEYERTPAEGSLGICWMGYCDLQKMDPSLKPKGFFMFRTSSGTRDHGWAGCCSIVFRTDYHSEPSFSHLPIHKVGSTHSNRYLLKDKDEDDEDGAAINLIEGSLDAIAQYIATTYSYLIEDSEGHEFSHQGFMHIDDYENLRKQMTGIP